MITEAMLAEAAAADSAALAAAAGSAEEALACHRDAVAALAAGWRSETGLAATDLLQQKCAEATDIVAELRRAAAELRSLHDGFADLSGGTTQAPLADDGRAAEQSIVATSSRPVGAPAPGQIREDPMPQPDPPAAVPGQALSPAPWAAQAPTGPWTPAPPGTPEAAPSWQPGGSIPPLPDVGGALVGLIAQIAQTLGSYADTGGLPPSEHHREEASSAATAAPRPPHRNPPPVTASAGPVSLPDSAIPKSAAPQNAVLQPNSPVLSQTPPELLPAERPPDPGGPPPPPPVTAAEPEPPPPTPAPVDPGPAPAAESKTPCEIAADELPKVGE